MTKNDKLNKQIDIKASAFSIRDTLETPILGSVYALTNRKRDFLEKKVKICIAGRNISAIQRI